MLLGFRNKEYQSKGKISQNSSERIQASGALFFFHKYTVSFNALNLKYTSVNLQGITAEGKNLDVKVSTEMVTQRNYLFSLKKYFTVLCEEAISYDAITSIYSYSNKNDRDIREYKITQLFDRHISEQ